MAVEILKKNSKMKNLFKNDLLYECVTFHEFGRHFSLDLESQFRQLKIAAVKGMLHGPAARVPFLGSHRTEPDCTQNMEDKV